MNNAFIAIQVVGLANVIKIFDMAIKDTYIEIVKILPELGGGVLNIILKGSVGQLKETEAIVRDALDSKKIEYKILVIPNFDFNIIYKDKKELHFNNNKL